MAEPAESTTRTQGGGDRRRLHALLLAGLAAVALLLSFEPTFLSYWALRLYSVLIALLPGVVVALACVGFGYPIIITAAPSLSKPERLLFSFASGLGIISCLIPILGFFGWLGLYTALAAIVVGLVLGVPLWRSLFHVAGRFAPVASAGLWQSTTVAAVLVLVSAMLLIFCLTPPLLFDVTEYHLGAWSDYLQPKGGVQFTAAPHNFYARFPFPIESIYYLGLTIAPYIDTAPKVFNGICVLACSYAAAVYVRWWGINRTGQLLAALAAVTLPVMLDVSIDAMIDAPVALLIVAAFMVAHRAAGKFPTQAAAEPALFLPALFLFSTALASKYTVAQLYLLPWLLLCLPLLFSREARPSMRKIITGILVAAIPCLVWFGKNWVLYSNPLEPFFVSIFRPADAAAIAREKFYIESHFPQSFLSASYWTTLLPRLHEFVWLYLVLCLALLFVARRAVGLRVLAFAAMAFLLWNLVRESQDRFLLPVMILVSGTAVAGVTSLPNQRLRRSLAAMVLLYCTMQTLTYGLKIKGSAAMDYLLDFYPTSTAAAPEDPATPREIFLEKNLGDLGKTLTDMRRQIPGARPLLIFEARPYLFRRMPSDPPVDYNVVWDESVLLNTIRRATTMDHAWQLLRDAGYTHLVVNRQELLRYIQQYARPSQLRRLGVRPGEDPRQAWNFTATPEDLYPPFYQDRDWEKLRPIVQGLLKGADSRAIIRYGLPSPGGNAQPIDIFASQVGH